MPSGRCTWLGWPDCNAITMPHTHAPQAWVHYHKPDGLVQCFSTFLGSQERTQRCVPTCYAGGGVCVLTDSACFESAG
eukprot:1161644-Pelagomonas_calceolata.AAC.10